ncbi:hypothetical protein CLAFUW4_05285 [Fulvia fulva]|uniref:Uncharacterized protein n=1 Tax=Passalora fulva TaxID=5499 RepID=A0A9Q8P913_PASFU|nr:uncharacterized protein CLAFUR5_05432 [Fulvia fulva]KAK4623594.1 hypothetical protein CLAFUR4_05279 [Fulvia fulva]KAK4624895.1 hypothetical protein CLAFUR0_05286 [Fulvia fulva]UJO17805.1 hypothetical protein CLAFUR5_05432 [Fulvia fulva]WPV15082.1 hypothetical protein CLAFUW4_05285 [Fulvia fulva]WPV30390.1 hypothetical protein CLAFUW7_05284 [Fulvia fulva]
MPGGITKNTRKQRDIALAAANAFLTVSADIQATILATAHNERDRRSKPTHLLGLPGELRNKIYSLALVSESDITVTATGPSQPPLIRTCHQIREEALSVYYTDNSFTLRVQDHNGVALEHFSLLRRQYFDGTRGDRLSKTTVQRVGKRSWKNLLAWLEAAHSRGMDIPVLPPSSTALQSREKVLLYSLADTAGVQLRQAPWDTVKVVLKGMRPALVRHHSKWGVD